uniref:Uncharacterized protein n=1 Tax=Arundo donax TaxID=35708 RepID=A0A0A9A607_ARUDO
MPVSPSCALPLAPSQLPSRSVDSLSSPFCLCGRATLPHPA